MRLPLFIIDAFADRVFKGNPAAVVPLQQWLGDAQMQAIAAENNLSATAFFVRDGLQFQLRWFTPKAEVDLCGHATLAAAHALMQHGGYQLDEIQFQSRSGLLKVFRFKDGYVLDFPALPPQPVAAPAEVLQSLGIAAQQVLAGRDDWLFVLESEAAVRAFNPEFAVAATLDKRGVVVSARATDYDFVSRCFYPKYGVPEDPMTGSAHCMLAPYWAQQLQRDDLRAYQASTRGGELLCRVRGERVELQGKAASYLIGAITI